MSRFCGKCDFYDHLWMNSDSEEVEASLAKSDIYITSKDGREHKLKINTIKDAAKYYPYLIVIGAFSKEHQTIILSSESFIDWEEREMLQYDIDDVYRFWRKCKREKIDFDKIDCYNKVHWSFSSEDKYLQEIISRIDRDGNKAKFEDIHKPIWERYRRNWFDELVHLGYSEIEAYKWCFNEWNFFDNNAVEKRLGRKINEEKN